MKKGGAKKGVRKSRRSWRNILIVISVILTLAVLLIIPIYQNKKEEERLEQLKMAYLESWAAENDRKNELQEMLEKEMTVDEIIDVARAKFGLVFSDEIVFMPED